MPINNILIVDDHPIVREGLAVVLSRFMGEEVECIQCDSVERLTSMLNHDIRHDLYILDLEFPKSDIFPVLGRICRQFPDSKILIYSMHNDAWILSHIDPSMIDGFVSKGESMDILLEAIKKISEGGEAFSEAFLEARGTCISSPDDDAVITERERQVLYYLSKGYSTNEIAEKLHISYFTAKTHRSHLAKKLHAKNAIEIVMKGKKYL